MEGTLLVASQLSSLFPASQGIVTPIPTSRRDLPLPPSPSDTDPPAEHASFSTVFHSDTTGTILLRVIHGGLTVELVSLTSDVPPIRFVFPALVLPAPGLFLSDDGQLHVLAITTTGSLYRLVLPATNGGKLWQEQFGKNWCREYDIKNATTEQFSGLVKAQGTHCVVVGLKNGSLLKLDTEYMGDDRNDDQWVETLFQHGSFLTAITSFLHHQVTGEHEFVTIATHPQPTDIEQIVTLSRDRTLRLWTARSGCISARTLPSTSGGRALTPAPSSASSPISKPQILLDAEPQNLIKLFVVDESPRALVFIPTPSSATSGGFFHLFSVDGEQLNSISSIECPVTTVHCHLQDFVVVGETLYALWDRQGQSVVEAIPLSLREQASMTPAGALWISASYAQEPELTPAYLDELLLAPGSMADKFFEAIMRPGTFSTLTLRTAIEQYTDACLSLSGISIPVQLRTTYATLGENIAAVVGCTVTLTRNSHTGAQQYDKYWNALKRDWEGFIARCRELERSARRPLALGVVGSDANVVIVERERIGAVVGEDQPLQLHRCLLQAAPVHGPYALLEVLWKVRAHLGPTVMQALEDHVVEMVHQELTYSIADIIDSQAKRMGIREALDPGIESWVSGRLQSIDSIDTATNAALDLIGGFDKEVKREEDEVELLLPPVNSEWTRALAASYVSATVQARYDLSLTLITLLFLADDLPEWDPSLLAEIFAVFRGVAMLRFVTHQPAGDAKDIQTLEDGISADDVAARMRDMQVSHQRTSRFTPTYSLLHRLLAQGNDGIDPASSAHRFLDNTGLLQSSSPAYATRLEVTFCERLRLLGYQDVAKELLSWLPPTPAVIYVLARLSLDVGRAEDAASLLESLSGSFGPDRALSNEDADALAAVLPNAELFASDFYHYVSMASFFAKAAETFYEVHFTQLAISVAPSDLDTSGLWYTAIKGNVDLAQYEDAYSVLITAPYDKLKRDLVSHLVYRMCEENAVEKLMTFNFAGLSDEVEDALSFKARNADPRVRPFYSRILYAWYVSKGDYRNAALAMYQRARRLAELTAPPHEILEIVELQREAYLMALNALSLLGQKNAWLIVPVVVDVNDESRKRRKLCKYIPENKFALGKRDAEMIKTDDIQREYTFVSSKLDLIQKEPELLASAGVILTPSSIVSRLAHARRFNTAMATARSLDVDMSDLFAFLTDQCIRLSRSPETVLQDDTSDWLLTDKVSSWPGTPAERGWRYLKQSLERHDSLQTDFKYSKVVLETLLSHDRFAPPPAWLMTILFESHPEWLIRTYLRYENLEAALEYSIALVRTAETRLLRDQPKTALSTWLPYNLIDQVLALAKAETDLPPAGENLRRTLDLELSNRVKRIAKASPAVV